MTNDPCIFCEIVAGRSPAALVHEWDDDIAFVPLNPVTPGHTLVVPRKHVDDFSVDPEASSATMYRASQLISWRAPVEAFNLITSRGREATQSVFHLHIHLVPRKKNDGLALPWGS